MSREMKPILLSAQDYAFTMKDIRTGRYQQLASCSSVKWGLAELYQFGYGRSEEYIILAMRTGDRAPGLWIGGRQETGRTWRTLCKTIAAGVP